MAFTDREPCSNDQSTRSLARITAQAIATPSSHPLITATLRNNNIASLIGSAEVTVLGLTVARSRVS
jgi:hypothetical protein